MAIDLTALKGELLNDPAALGYTGDDVGDAGILNTVRTGTDGVTRKRIGTEEIREAIDYAADWGNVSAALRDALLLVTAGDSVDVESPNVRSVFTAAFPAGSPTRAALVDLLTRDGTRAEELFGPGTRVTPSDVANARRS